MNPLNHVAIIMDGNGRWGLKNKKSRNLGHKKGISVVENIIQETIKKKIKFLTLFAFSTENWKRPQHEINYLLNLLEKFLKEKTKKFTDENIKLKIIGKKNFSTKLNKLLIYAEKKTEFLFIAGKPIGEPIARGGPFVMNTKAEILEAIQDYNNGTFAKY